MRYNDIAEFHSTTGILKLFIITSLRLIRLGFNKTVGFISGVFGSYCFYYVSQPKSSTLFCSPIKYSYQVCEAIFNNTK
nr:TPA_asm: hypothetical protein [Becan tricladivirus 2]